MCGRFAQAESEETVMQTFGVQHSEVLLTPRYNVAPTQDVPVIMQDSGVRRLEMCRWGLIPSWAKEAGKGLINARAETVAEKPSFRNALFRRRCLLPATGFYEWQARAEGKQPMFIRLKDDQPMGMAGLWEMCRDPESGLVQRTFTIITVAANAFMAPIHQRMPAILDPAAAGCWLDESRKPADQLLCLLQPCDPDWLEAWPVSRQVNSPRYDAPDCLTPL